MECGFYLMQLAGYTVFTVLLQFTIFIQMTTTTTTKSSTSSTSSSFTNQNQLSQLYSCPWDIFRTFCFFLSAIFYLPNCCLGLIHALRAYSSSCLYTVCTNVTGLLEKCPDYVHVYVEYYFIHATQMWGKKRIFIALRLFLTRKRRCTGRQTNFNF